MCEGILILTLIIPDATMDLQNYYGGNICETRYTKKVLAVLLSAFNSWGLRRRWRHKAEKTRMMRPTRITLCSTPTATPILWAILRTT